MSQSHDRILSKHQSWQKWVVFRTGAAMKLKIIAFLFLASVQFSNAHAQCTAQDQADHDYCVMNSISGTCYQAYPLCRTHAETLDNFKYQFEAQCCCVDGERGPKSHYLPCRNKNLEGVKKMHDLMTWMGEEMYRYLRTHNYSKCPDACDG